MGNLKVKFINNRLCLNVLANSVENARELYEAAEGHILLGVLSKNFANDEMAIKEMANYQRAIDNALSIGLGAGDPNQSQMVTRLAEKLQPQHVNQVLTGVSGTRMALKQGETIVNGLVSPTGKVGYVNIATGPLSATKGPVEVPINQAIYLLKDMGASSLKFYSMDGLAHLAEYHAICEACAAEQFWIEPTGGIDLENYEKIIRIPLELGVEKVIPHIYSSIIDQDTGDTNPQKVAQLYRLSQRVLKDFN